MSGKWKYLGAGHSFGGGRDDLPNRHYVPPSPDARPFLGPALERVDALPLAEWGNIPFRYLELVVPGKSGEVRLDAETEKLLLLVPVQRAPGEYIRSSVHVRVSLQRGKWGWEIRFDPV